MTETLPEWRLADGSAVGCAEKLRLLAEAEAEIGERLLDAFEDAVLMGLDAERVRSRLAAFAALRIAALRSPLRG
ncbi:hypothetical protein FHR90_000491 [Endobacter medicaginis]|uniref:Uncharacterized protein n=2 Tax=Endobacter medicaginis TaxID=1181271 RepID=A0A839USC8_9PROT|nr:hypothetical protein [Endobacter medicaginis]MBB3172677.1 hypothetical protein [Endobacter medicaginis]MCX5475683.1 hypothetical protein [Endobacter medicaginis]